MTYVLVFFLAFIFWACVLFGVRWWLRWREEKDWQDRFEHLELRGQALERLENWTDMAFSEARASNERLLKEAKVLQESTQDNKPSQNR